MSEVRLCKDTPDLFLDLFCGFENKSVLKAMETNCCFWLQVQFVRMNLK